LLSFDLYQEETQAQEKTSHSTSGSNEQQKLQEDKTTQQSKAGPYSQRHEILVSDSDEE
jgi:hypothetical protein